MRRKQAVNLSKGRVLPKCKNHKTYERKYLLSARHGNNVPSFVQVGTISFRNSEYMPLYQKATENMLLEQDNVFSMFALFLGAEIQQKTAVAPQKVYDGSLMTGTNIMPELSENCNTETKEN